MISVVLEAMNYVKFGHWSHRGSVHDCKWHSFDAHKNK